MGTAFWVKRFFVVMLGAAAIISLVQWLKGHGLEYALVQGVLWGAISATIFVSARIYQSRRGMHCSICKDTPEMR
ncbi:hypothetical protein [Dyella amyloliquefaciens]|uniref:hypothetical protein n=1 Tax=Dyella amyloliquefaciens TaxID=1770545 RepID=UPI00102E2A18|nr:hypothetical protein [Dyella amyloliquefaciens]